MAWMKDCTLKKELNASLCKCPGFYATYFQLVMWIPGTRDGLSLGRDTQIPTVQFWAVCKIYFCFILEYNLLVSARWGVESSVLWMWPWARHKVLSCQVRGTVSYHTHSKMMGIRSRCPSNLCWNFISSAVGLGGKGFQKWLAPRALPVWTGSGPLESVFTRGSAL